MPMDRSAYPADWEAIARRVKNAANWQCQNCGRPCRMPGEDLSEFCDRVQTARLSECPVIAEVIETPQRFVLTVAHLDQNPQNNSPSNLKALCSVCHLHHDRPWRHHNAYRKRERRGQLSLPL